MKRLSDKEMRDAIRDGYRKYGKGYHHSGIMSWVVKTYNCDPPSWQKVRGIKARIRDHEWRVWESERGTNSDRSLRGFDKKVEYTEDEVHTTYTPKEIPGSALNDGCPLHPHSEYPLTGEGLMTTEEAGEMRLRDAAKLDYEIVAVLNLCIDWNKFQRFMTLSDEKRLDKIARDFGLAFSHESFGRFGLARNDGGFTGCQLS